MCFTRPASATPRRGRRSCSPEAARGALPPCPAPGPPLQHRAAGAGATVAGGRVVPCRRMLFPGPPLQHRAAGAGPAVPGARVVPCRLVLPPARLCNTAPRAPELQHRGCARRLAALWSPPAPLQHRAAGVGGAVPGVRFVACRVAFALRRLLRRGAGGAIARVPGAGRGRAARNEAQGPGRQGRGWPGPGRRGRGAGAGARRPGRRRHGRGRAGGNDTQSRDGRSRGTRPGLARRDRGAGGEEE